MMTRTHMILALALAASMAACGSDSTPAVTTPVADAGSSSGGDATAANDSASGTADTASSSGGGPVDAGSQPVDAGPTKPKKCQPQDSVCLETCAAAQCKKEQTACTNDAKCTGFVQCVGACQQGTEPPGNVEGATCVDKCRTIAGKSAVDVYLTLNGCTLNECVDIQKCDSTMPQQQFTQCANLCIQAKCLIPAQECNGDKNCAWVGQCLTDCQNNKAPPPWPPKDHKPDPAFLPAGVTATLTCSDKCYGSVPFESSRRFLANVICSQSQCIKQPYTAPCPQTNVACVNACALDKCDSAFGQCTDDQACSAYYACVQVKKCGQSQACSTACQQYVMTKYGAADAGSAISTFQGISQCAVSSCIGGL